MNTVSLQARRAFHSLSVIRDFNGLINYFVKSKDSKVFTKNLPIVISFAINRANDFHRAILEAHTVVRKYELTISMEERTFELWQKEQDYY